MAERKSGGNPLARIIRRPFPEASSGEALGVARLSEEQRKAYPQVIYTLESTSPTDQVLVQTSFQSMTVS